MYYWYPQQEKVIWNPQLQALPPQRRLCPHNTGYAPQNSLFPQHRLCSPPQTAPPPPQAVPPSTQAVVPSTPQYCLLGFCMKLRALWSELTRLNQPVTWCRACVSPPVDLRKWNPDGLTQTSQSRNTAVRTGASKWLWCTLKFYRC